MPMEVSIAFLMEVAREAKLSSYAISGTTQAQYPGVPQGYDVLSALPWQQRPWAMCDGCGLAFYVAELAGHILSPRKDESLKVHSITDSRSLYETLGSTKLVSDKRLRAEISALRQMVNEGKVSVEWVEGAKQLADVLTKQGVSWKLLQFVLREGKLSLQ